MINWFRQSIPKQIDAEIDAAERTLLEVEGRAEELEAQKACLIARIKRLNKHKGELNGKASKARDGLDGDSRPAVGSTVRRAGGKESRAKSRRTDDSDVHGAGSDSIRFGNT